MYDEIIALYFKKVIEAPDVMQCIDLDEIAETIRYFIDKDLGPAIWNYCTAHRDEGQKAIDAAFESGAIKEEVF